MPSRVIREGLLDSQRYWSVTVEARQLFVHLMLLADDFGLVGLAPVFVRRRCFDDAPAPAKIDKLLEQLQDADLVRVYTAGPGSNPAKYAFIPRFGQRLRQMRARHPKPPAGLYEDDEAAKNLFNLHAHLFEKLSSTWRRTAAKSRPEVELKGNERDWETKRAVAKVLPTGTPASEWASHLGLERLPGEAEGAFQARVLDAKQSHIEGACAQRDEDGPG